jgi:hypothetical protein
MVDYTKFKLKSKVPEPKEILKFVEDYLKGITEENRPTKWLKCENCGNIYVSQNDALLNDICVKNFKAYNFTVTKIKEKRPKELKSPTICGLARFIGITEKELINLFNETEETKRVYEFFQTIMNADIDANLENPDTSNTKGIIYSAINKHGYSENGAVQNDEKLCFVNDVDKK